MSKNEDIVIQKADKANTVVILDKCSYKSLMEQILNDNSKFSKLDVPADKEINHIVKLEKRITSEFKLLKEKKDKEIIDKSTYKSIKPVGSRPGILYGLGKIHKENRKGIPPIDRILSAFLCTVLKVNGFEIVLMISSLCSVDVISMTYLYCFRLLITEINLWSICHLNIPT